VFLPAPGSEHASGEEADRYLRSSPHGSCSIPAIATNSSTVMVVLVMLMLMLLP
jgi:hypothetical protein